MCSDVWRTETVTPQHALLSDIIRSSFLWITRWKYEFKQTKWMTYCERLLKITYLIFSLRTCLCCYFSVHSAEKVLSPQNCLLVRAVGTLARSLVNLARALITGIRWHSHISKVQDLTTRGKMASVSQHKDWFGLLTLLHLSLTPCDTLSHKLAHYLTAFSINCIKGGNRRSWSWGTNSDVSFVLTHRPVSLELGKSQLHSIFCWIMKRSFNFTRAQYFIFLYCLS